MYTNTITAISQEVLRLVSKQQEMLSELLTTENVLKEAKDGQERSLDRNIVQLWNKTLQDERAKVEGLEMTLAVVGTMKAGKSTTINTIIGREVLPNRNRPMTTLPTVIRHKEGQITPRLKLPKPEPFNNALAQIKQLLHNLKPADLERLPISMSDDGKKLIDDILYGRLSALDGIYEGTEGIFEFLKSLNDISRICDGKNLNIPSPLMEYNSILDFPLIEVEFFHLKGKEQQVKGSLALIDTPGPNEAGQPHLRAILEEQLQKASAVMAVLDYTQLNSEADAEVRAAIEQVTNHSGDRLFVLVNKFDQKDRNSMGEDDVKRYVSRELFDSDLPQERVFPVSSQLGYLANYALNELAMSGKLPSPQKAEWVGDFGTKAFGMDWEEELEDTGRVKQSAEKLWKKSMFIKPLDEVITRAYQEAAVIALKSAVEKMSSYDTEIVQYLKIRHGSIHIDINVLQQLIKELEDNIRRIEAAQESANQIADTALKQLSAKTNDIFQQGNATLKQVIENLFLHGKRIEAQQARLEEAGKKRSGATRIAQQLGSLLSGQFKSNAYIEISQSGTNKFSSRREASAFLDKINDAVEQDTGKISNEIQLLVNHSVQDMENQLQQQINENVQPVLEHAAQTLNDAFDLRLSFKQQAMKPIKVDFSQITRNSIEEKSVEKTKTQYERRWYTLWIKEHAVQYTVHEDEFHIDTKRIGKEVIKQLEGVQQKLEKDLEKYISKELGSNLTSHFDEMKHYLDKFRGNLLDGLKDKQESEESLGKLLLAMDRLMLIADEHQKDVDPVLEELNDERLGEKAGAWV